MRRVGHFCTALVGIVMSLAGCDATHIDVSGSAEHKIFIGAACEVKTPLHFFGVTEKLERNKSTDLVVVTSLRLSGPEITFRGSLESGTRFKIVAARQCTNCPFETRVEYQIKVVPEPTAFAGKPVFLEEVSVLAKHVSCGAASSAA